MASVYKAIADPTRRKIMQLLREGDLTAGEIAEQFDFSWPTISRHISVLREADLVQGTKVGTTITYRLNVTVLEEAMAYLMEMFQIDREVSDEKQASNVQL